MVWIEPLQLERWLINVFAGDSSYFVALALFIILGLSAYFRMNSITLGFMVITFLLMFSGYIPKTLLIFIAIFGGLVVGHAVSNIVKDR
ncbi:MAG: hypothetical protein ACLFPS_05860 [Clostridia bacterium]